MALKNAKYFDSDEDWERFASEHGYSLRVAPYPAVSLDISGDREAQKISEGEWETLHPLRVVGYQTRSERVKVRDGSYVWIKICRSTRVGPDEKLPLVFVTHGGGWVQGTPITEEAWLLWPLLQGFDLVTVSVDYRLAPEYTYPTFINDCWDALKDLVGRSEELGFDPQKVILAGSSAGACIATSLAQQARDYSLPIQGVIANVPITCDPRHFPKEEFEYTSYDQCQGTLFSSGEMEAMWKLVVPGNDDGKNPLVSPLLGDLKGLPPHAIFVAGQDPLRDEGIAYYEKLKMAGVSAAIHVYQGVPHTFAEFWDLKLTQRFWGDIRVGLKAMIEQ